MSSQVLVPCDVGSGGLIEFELAIQLGRCDGWGSDGQADSGEEGLDGNRLGEGGDDLHVTGARRADGDVVLEHSGQELGLGHSMSPSPSCRAVLTTFGLRQGTGTRHDLGPIRAGRRQDAVVAHQVESWWWHEGGQFLQ
jgi:hypothetical protein